MFTKIEIKNEQPEGTIPMEATIYNPATGKHETLFVEYVAPEQAKACAIPPRNELKLDYAKIAELQIWQNELMSRFGH